MNARSPNLTAYAIALLLGITGCLDRPRNGELLPAKGTSSPVSGLVSKPNSFVKYYMRSGPGKSWHDMAYGTTSGTEPTVDATGMEWFRFSANYTFPGTFNLWRAAPKSGTQRRIMSEFRAQSAADGNLATFDTNADQCGQDNAEGGLIGILNNCTSDKSPVAEVFRKCGKANQDCCHAIDIDDEDACDAGRKCGSTNKCTIPSGALNQVCNADNTCNTAGLGCIAGTCRDTTIEKLPLSTLDLRVTTCDDPSWNLQSSGSKLFVNLGTDDIQIEVPGTELTNNTVDTFGLSPMDITRLGHIRQLEIEVRNRKWCVKKVELIANGSDVVFSKSYASPQYLLATYPIDVSRITIPRDELRTYWTTRNWAPYCDAPTRLSGAAMERKITGLIGQVLVNSDDFDGNFNHGGFVRYRRVNDATGRLSARAYVETYVNGIGNVGVSVELSFTLTFACTNGTIGLSMSEISVDDLDGDFGYDVLNIATGGLVEAIGTAAAQLILNDATGSLRESFDSLSADLPVCPPLALDTAAPPNLNITIPIDPSLVNICL